MHDQNFQDSNPQEPNIQEPTPQQQPTRIPIPGRIILGLSAVVLIAGSATAWLTWRTFQAQNPVTPDVPTQVSPSPTTEPVTQPEQQVQIYWLRDTGTNLELVPSEITVQAEDDPDAVLQAAFESLMQGTEASEVASTIPEGTQLLSLDVREDGVHVDLSSEFTTGGGSAGMMGRLGQVIYTASSLDPTAPVWISVDGEPLEMLGGEGLLVDQPMTREIFEQNFPL